MNFARVAGRRRVGGEWEHVEPGVAHIVASQNETLVFTACRVRLYARECLFEKGDRPSVPVCWVCEGKRPKGV